MATARASAGAWLVKSEPGTYSWDDLVEEEHTRWDGVRNFEARNNLRAMKADDLVLFYHSGEGKEIVGVARVLREAYPDPAAKGEDWSAVDIEPVKRLTSPVALAAIKSDRKLSGFALIRRSRLSVVPVTPTELARLLELGKTKL